MRKNLFDIHVMQMGDNAKFIYSMMIQLATFCYSGLILSNYMDFCRFHLLDEIYIKGQKVTFSQWPLLRFNRHT